MKILFILPYVPYPLDSGGNQAVFTMLDYLKDRHEISLLLSTHGENAAKNVEKLKEALGNVFIFHHKKAAKAMLPEEDFGYMPPLPQKVCRIALSVANSMQRKINRRRRKYKVVQQQDGVGSDFIRFNSTLFARNEYLTSDYCQYVRDVANQGFDIVQVEFYELLPLVYVLPRDVRKIFVHHELRFVRNANEMALFKESHIKDPIRYAEEKACELAALSLYDDVITLSEIDKNLLLEELPSLSIHVSPAALFMAQEKVAFKIQPARSFVFVGSGNHLPNADGLLWFCQEILPIFRTYEQEQVKVYVVGNWSETLRRVVTTNNPEIEFTGFVDDLQAFLNGKISIVPIRIGSGIRIKILEAVVSKSPFISTAKGCEGLPALHGQNCLVADTPQDFAQAMQLLLHDSGSQQKLALCASETINSLQGRDKILELRNNIYLKK